MKVKDFLACIKSLDLDGYEDVFELEMTLCPSVQSGSDLIWISCNDRYLFFSTREQLLKDGYSEDAITEIENCDYVHHDIS